MKKEHPGMANLKNRKKFSSEYQPQSNGRRANVLRLLAAEAQQEFGVQLSRTDKYQIINSMMEKSLKELKDIKNDKTCPIFMVSIAAAILADIARGQTPTVQMVFDRMYGKPTQPSEISSPDGKAINISANSMDAELVAKMFGVKVQDGIDNTESD